MADDTISRKAAIDVILAINDYGNSDRANALGLAEFKITTLPTAEPQWIPCSKQMPVEKVDVWVTIAGHDVIIRKDGETIEDAIDRISKTRWVTQGFLAEDGWYGADGYPMVVRPIAWMPLEKPKAYEGKV